MNRTRNVNDSTRKLRYCSSSLFFSRADGAQVDLGVGSVQIVENYDHFLVISGPKIDPLNLSNLVWDPGLVAFIKAKSWITNVI
ncbi:unnamed protein product [Dovyalis caffra]|uniref:Uncharacterized protein n=1 Tax=Dovyalis caffra TaxID=77055 RepID=A0AAV1SUJ7_9ROSI|nr:unnamed protein product [Dovyalis caffra]